MQVTGSSANISRMGDCPPTEPARRTRRGLFHNTLEQPPRRLQEGQGLVLVLEMKVTEEPRDSALSHRSRQPGQTEQESMRVGFLPVRPPVVCLCIPAHPSPIRTPLAFQAPPKSSFEDRQGSLLLSYLLKVCLLGEQRH